MEIKTRISKEQELVNPIKPSAHSCYIAVVEQFNLSINAIFDQFLSCIWIQLYKTLRMALIVIGFCGVVGCRSAR